MVKRLSVCGWVLLITSGVLAGCGGGGGSGTTGDEANVISAKGFVASCTLKTESDGKTFQGKFNGPFNVKAGKFTTDTSLDLTMTKEGDPKEWNYKLKVKSGAIVDSDKEIFDFVATDSKSGHDIKVHYDGTQKQAEVTYLTSVPFIKKSVTFASECAFTDSATSAPARVQ